VKASAVLAALDAAGVSIEDVIHDGMLRYKALVAFEAAKELELQQVARPATSGGSGAGRPRWRPSRRRSSGDRPRSAGGGGAR
jgi:hypothetical protein